MEYKNAPVSVHRHQFLANHPTSNNLHKTTAAQSRTLKMAFKLVVLAAALAAANAGLTPVAYSPASAVSSAYINTAAAYAAPLAAVHAPHYGASSQSVVRSPLGGTVSHYDKAVDSAFSSVRKYDTRITNDAYAYAAAPVVAKTAYAAPVAHYAAAPVVAKAAYAAPVAHYAAAPVAHYAAAPVITKTAYAAAPVVAKAAIAYSPAVAVSHMTFAGPFATYQW